jgi:transcriptional regulator with XRE-family HTH domain
MDPEVKRLITLLKTAMRILEVTNRDVERKLEVSPSYLSRLFSGGIELKAEHLVKIPQAMGMHPAEFFQLAYPRLPARQSTAATQLQEVLRELQPLAQGPAPEDLRTALREMLREELEQIRGKAGE